MNISVRLFASMREAAGESLIRLELESGARVADAWEALSAQVPGLEKYRGRALAAVNRRYVSTDEQLAEGDELALFPPVSGG